MFDSFSAFAEALVFEFVVAMLGAFCGFLLSRYVVDRYQQRKWGKWNIIVIKADGEEGTNRPIRAGKVKTIIDDDNELSVFLKGVVSPFGWLNVDPCIDGRKIGMLTVNHETRDIIVDFRKNPPKEGLLESPNA